MSAGGQDGGQRGAESHEPDASESCRVCVAMMGGRHCQLLCDILRSRTSSGLPQCFCWVGVQGAAGCPLGVAPCTPTWGGSEGPGYPLGAPSEPPQQNQCG